MKTPYMDGTVGTEDRKMEEAGQRIARNDFSLANLKIVCGWKSERRLDLLDKNDAQMIEQALRRAIDAADDRDAVDSLIPLVERSQMASAILTAIFPERYTVLDFRALEALGVKDTDNA